MLPLNVHPLLFLRNNEEIVRAWELVAFFSVSVRSDPFTESTSIPTSAECISSIIILSPYIKAIFARLVF